MLLVLKGGRSISLDQAFEIPAGDDESFAAQMTRVPVRARLEPMALELRAFGAVVRLELERLATHQNYAIGDGWIAVAARADGERFLAGLAKVLDLEVPTSGGERGPLDRLHANVQVARSQTAVWLAIEIEGLTLNLGLKGPNDPEAVIVVGSPPRAWEDFSWQWMLAFVEGLEPRVSRAGDPKLESELPWIANVEPLVGSEGLDLSEALFGGDVAFAMIPVEAGDAEEDEMPQTRVLAWVAPNEGPRVLGEISAVELSLFPSPDGQLLLIQADRPYGEGGRLLLTRVSDGASKEVISPERALAGPSANWSEDGRRFSVCASPLWISDTGVRVVLIYDLNAEGFIDVCVHSSIPDKWVGTSLHLTKTEFTREGRSLRHFQWTPGRGGEPEALLGPPSEPIANDEFFLRWRCGYLMDEMKDTRVLDPRTGMWRYLAERSAGSPVTCAPNGKRVLFRRGAGYAIGGDDLPAPPPAEAQRWSESDPARVSATAAFLEEARATPFEAS